MIVGLFFSHLGFWSWNLFLIAPFPDLCLLVPFYMTLLYIRLRQCSISMFKTYKRTSNIISKREFVLNEKVQVGKDQEKAQSEKDSHSKNRGGKKPN